MRILKILQQVCRGTAWQAIAGGALKKPTSKLPLKLAHRVCRLADFHNSGPAVPLCRRSQDLCLCLDWERVRERDRAVTVTVVSDRLSNLLRKLDEASPEPASCPFTNVRQKRTRRCF